MVVRDDYPASKSPTRRAREAEAEWIEFMKPFEQSSEPRLKEKYKPFNAIHPPRLQTYLKIGSVGVLGMPEKVFRERCKDMNIDDNETDLAYTYVLSMRGLYQNNTDLPVAIRERVVPFDLSRWPYREYKKRYRNASNLTYTTGQHMAGEKRERKHQDEIDFFLTANRNARLNHGVDEPQWFTLDFRHHNYNDPNRVWINPTNQNSTQ
jgi:hypothetical protein